MYILNMLESAHYSVALGKLRNLHEMMKHRQQRKEEKKGTGPPLQTLSLSLWSADSVHGSHDCCVILVMVTSEGFLIDVSACTDLFALQLGVTHLAWPGFLS